MRSLSVAFGLAFLTLMMACERIDAPSSSQGAARQAADGAKETVRDSGGPFDEKELVAILQQRSVYGMAASLNKVKKLGASREGLGMLERVWRKEQGKLPELSWDVLSDPEVRLNIVDLLEQAAQNGEIQSAPADMHAYVLGVLANAPPTVAGQAAITLSVFEREDDVQILEKMALQKDRRTFRAIVIALANMCPDEARSALARISQSSSGEDKAFVDDTSLRMQKFKRQLCRK